MARDINKVLIIGRLTRDPETKTIPSGTSIAKFGIAVNRRYTVNNETREEVSFFNCVGWGKLVDVIRQYCQKGKQVAIEGRLRQNRWQDQSGQNKSTVEIVIDNLQLLGGAAPGDTNKEDGPPVTTNKEDGPPVTTNKKNDDSPSPDAYSETPDMLDDDIPF